MPRPIRTTIFFLVLVCSAYSGSAQEPGAAANADNLVELPVFNASAGRSPGPPIWQVSNGEHLVWIFGIPDPYHEDDYRWDQRTVRDLLSRSQAFIPAPERGMPLNPVQAVLIGIEVGRMSSLPDDLRLEDVVPPDLYARLLAVKDNFYRGDRRMQKLRPRTIGQQIYAETVKRNDMVTIAYSGSRNRISRQVERIAKGRDMELEIFHMKWSARDLKEVRLNMDPDLECLESALDALDDVEGMISRSHAWARGDARPFRAYDYPRPLQTCAAKVPQGQSAMFSEQDEMRALWLDAVVEAMNKHERTFSTMSIDDLVRPDGLLEVLLAKGYSVSIL